MKRTLGFAASVICMALPPVVYSQSDAELDFLLNDPAPSAAPATSEDATVSTQAPVDPSAEVVETIPLAAPAAAPDDVAPQRPRSRLVEEIIVTAQKREENIQDVAVSVQGFSADFLDAKGVSDPAALPQITPGLTLGSQAGFSVTYLRGVGSEAYLTADPSVALYIDGVYFPFAHGSVQNFGALERIEVLKGPQGTLFGRNAVGGAINVLSKRPELDEFSVSVQTGYGTFSDWQNQVAVNLPLGDTLALGIAGFYNRSELPMTGTIAGQQFPEELSRGVRARLRWMPTDSLDITISGLRLLQSGLSTLFALNSDPSPLSRLLGVQPQTGYDGAVDDPSYLKVSNSVAYGEGVWSTDWMDVKLIGSYQDIATAGRYDLDGSPVPIASLDAPRQFAEVKTAEIQFLSNESSWGADKLTWILGGYWFSSDQGPSDVILRLVGLDLAEGSLLGLQLPAVSALLRRIAEVAPGMANLIPTGGVYLKGILATESSAAFAQATYHMTDWMALTLGARYQYEERRIVESSASLATVGGRPIGLFDFERKSVSTESVKPKATIELRPFDNTLVYLSYQEAIKGATFNVLNVYTQPDEVRPEEMVAYEVGVKTDFFDGLVRLNAAAFHYDITDIQVQFISLLAGGAVTFENAGGALVQGIDFDILAELFPDIIDGLVLTLGGAWLDAKYTDYTNGSGFSEPGRLFSGGNDYTGNRVTRTPEFSGFVDLSKTTYTSWGPIEIAADVYHNSGFFYLAQNTSFNEELAYTVVGARASMMYEPWNLRVTVFGKNLNNANYNLSRYIDDFGSLDAKAPTRTFGVRLNWTF